MVITQPYIIVKIDLKKPGQSHLFCQTPKHLVILYHYQNENHWKGTSSEASLNIYTVKLRLSVRLKLAPPSNKRPPLE